MLSQEEVMPYKRIYHGIKPTVEKNVKTVSFQLVALYIAAFFIARVFLLNSMMPFGIAFFVSAYIILNLEAAFITGLMVILGYASTLKESFAFSHMLVVLIIMVVMLVLKNKDKNKVLRISIYSFFINFIICTSFQYNII